LIEVDVLFLNARLEAGEIVDIAVTGGRIAAIGVGKRTSVSANETIDLKKRLVLPGLVDGHLHLDKGFLGDDWRSYRPCTADFDVHERVRFEKEALAAALPAAVRGAAAADQCIAHGTTHMRSHVDIDPQVGLRNLEEIAAVRESHRDRVSIQIVAFPQSGIVSAPGTRELLEEALRNGADVIGGLDPAGYDRDIAGHLDPIFDIAERHGVGVDIHLHDGDLLGIFQIEEIARRTKACGLDGKVAIAHAYALGQVSSDVARRTADKLAGAGISIMSNAPGAHAFPPLKLLHQAGVNVFAGNDNIRDSWWPFGDGDMLERAMIIAYRSGLNTDEDLRFAFDMVTTNAARALGIEGYGLAEGAIADFIVLDARHVPEAVVARPKSRDVYKAGRRAAGNGRTATSLTS
jgi:cytosine deaminase